MSLRGFYSPFYNEFLEDGQDIVQFQTSLGLN